MSDHEAPPMLTRPRRPPMIRRPRQERHPFQEMNHNHFPGLDLGMKPQQHQHQHQQLYPDLDDTVNESTCSSSNALDMSIGARSSMTEHLRHIAKFGLEYTSRESSVMAFHPRDDEWNRLLDTTSSAWSAVDESFNPLETTVQDYDLDAIEVIADVSSDFFNSSRVLELSTPEKNMNRAHTVTTRSRDAPQYEESETGSLPESDGSTMLNMFKAAMHLNATEDRDSSFVSFSGVDVSRISALNESFADPRRSPDWSVDFSQPLDLATPSSLFKRDLSFSTPGRNDNHQPWQSLRVSPASSLFFLSPPKSTASRTTTIDDRDKFDSLCLSPIEARAGHTARKGSKKSPGKHPLSPKLFPDQSSDEGDVIFENLVNQRGVTPRSSVSKHGLQRRSHSRQLDSSVLSDDDFSSNNCKTKSCNFLQNESSSSSSMNVRPGIDRRRFRTVVPHRVFIDEPSDFPDQADDSFSTPSVNVATITSTDDFSNHLRSTSLLRCFDEVAEDEFDLEKRQAC